MAFFKSAAYILHLWTPKTAEEHRRLVEKSGFFDLAPRVLKRTKSLKVFSREANPEALTAIVNQCYLKGGVDGTAPVLREHCLKQHPLLLLQMLQKLNPEMAKGILGNKHFRQRLVKKSQTEYVLSTMLLANNSFVEEGDYQRELAQILVTLVKDHRYFSIIEDRREHIQALLFTVTLLPYFIIEAGKNGAVAERLLDNQTFQHDPNFAFYTATILAEQALHAGHLMYLNWPSITADVVNQLICQEKTLNILTQAFQTDPTLAAQLITHPHCVALNHQAQENFTNDCLRRYGDSTQFIGQLFACKDPNAIGYKNIVNWLLDDTRCDNTERVALSKFAYARAFLENEALLQSASLLTLAKLLKQYAHLLSETLLDAVYRAIQPTLDNQNPSNVFSLLALNDEAACDLLSEDNAVPVDYLLDFQKDLRGDDGGDLAALYAEFEAPCEYDFPAIPSLGGDDDAETLAVKPKQPLDMQVIGRGKGKKIQQKAQEAAQYLEDIDAPNPKPIMDKHSAQHHSVPDLLAASAASASTASQKKPAPLDMNVIGRGAGKKMQKKAREQAGFVTVDLEEEEVEPSQPVAIPSMDSSNNEAAPLTRSPKRAIPNMHVIGRSLGRKIQGSGGEIAIPPLDFTGLDQTSDDGSASPSTVSYAVLSSSSDDDDLWDLTESESESEDKNEGDPELQTPVVEAAPAPKPAPASKKKKNKALNLTRSSSRLLGGSITHGKKKRATVLPDQTQTVEKGRSFKQILMEKRATARLVISNEEQLIAMMMQIEAGKAPILSMDDLVSVANRWDQTFIAGNLVNLIKHIQLDGIGDQDIKQAFLEKLNQILQKMSSEALTSLLLDNANNPLFLNNLASAISQIRVKDERHLDREKFNLTKKLSSKKSNKQLKRILKAENNGVLIEVFGVDLLPLIKKPVNSKKLLLNAAAQNLDLGIAMLQHKQYQALIFLDHPRAQQLRAALGNNLIRYGLSQEGFFEQHETMILQAALDNPETARALATHDNKLLGIQAKLLTHRCHAEYQPILGNWDALLIEHVREQDIFQLANSRDPDLLNKAFTLIGDGGNNTIVAKRLLDENQWQFASFRLALFEDTDQAMAARIALGIHLVNYIARQDETLIEKRTKEVIDGKSITIKTPVKVLKHDATFVANNQDIILKTAENNHFFAIGIGSSFPCFHGLQRAIINPENAGRYATLLEHWGPELSATVSDHPEPEQAPKPKKSPKKNARFKAPINLEKKGKAKNTTPLSEKMLPILISLAARSRTIALALFKYKAKQEDSQLHKATDADLESKIAMLRLVAEDYEGDPAFDAKKGLFSYKLRQNISRSKDIKRVLNDKRLAWILSPAEIQAFIAPKQKLVGDEKFLLKLAYQSPALADVVLDVGSLSKTALAKILRHHCDHQDFIERLQRSTLCYQKKPINLTKLKKDKHAKKIIDSAKILKTLEQDHKKKAHKPVAVPAAASPAAAAAVPAPPPLAAALLQRRAQAAPIIPSNGALLSEIVNWNKSKFTNSVSDQDRAARPAGSLFAELLTRANGQEREPFVQTPKGIKPQSFALFLRDLFQIWKNNTPGVEVRYGSFARDNAEHFKVAMEKIYTTRAKPEQKTIEKALCALMGHLAIDVLTVENFESDHIQGNIITGYSSLWIEGIQAEHAFRRSRKGQGPDQDMSDSLAQQLAKMRAVVELNRPEEDDRDNAGWEDEPIIPPASSSLGMRVI